MPTADHVNTDPTPADRARRLARYHAAVELQAARDHLRLTVDLGLNTRTDAARLVAAQRTWDHLARYRPDTHGRAAA